LNGADPKNKKFIKKLFLKNVSREILDKELLEKSLEKNTRNRDKNIRRELIEKSFKPEFIKLADQLTIVYKNDNIVQAIIDAKKRNIRVIPKKLIKSHYIKIELRYCKVRND
jgi:regulator of sirC expression with transglutaminase-like and TPR domain